MGSADRIRERAYFLWEARGRPLWSPLVDWLAAEAAEAAESLNGDADWARDVDAFGPCFGGAAFRTFAGGQSGPGRLPAVAALGTVLFDAGLMALLLARRGRLEEAQAALNRVVAAAKLLDHWYRHPAEMGAHGLGSPVNPSGAAPGPVDHEGHPWAILHEIAKWNQYGTFQVLAHLAIDIRNSARFKGMQRSLLDAARDVDKICLGGAGA